MLFTSLYSTEYSYVVYIPNVLIYFEGTSSCNYEWSRTTSLAPYQCRHL